MGGGWYTIQESLVVAWFWGYTKQASELFLVGVREPIGGERDQTPVA